MRGHDTTGRRPTSVESLTLTSVSRLSGPSVGRRPDLVAAGILMAAVTGWAMFQEVTTFGRPGAMWTGADFADNTWRAVRGLIAGQNVYAAGTWIPRIGHVQPVAEHVPATLTWEAPFAALPLGPALYAFTLASLVAIWAGVFILTRPRAPRDVLVATCCGAFAILAGGGPWTLLLGQPTGFILLGLATMLRARKPWVGALGFLLAASTIQVGLPLALALVVLRQWPTVWRGALMTAGLSLPPVALSALKAGALPFAGIYVSNGAGLLGQISNRIDLGALLHREEIGSTAVQVGIGASVLILALPFLARLPDELKRIDYPPVLSLVISVTLLCTYHQPYDMLLVGAAVVPVTVTSTRSVSMLPIFGLAGISAAVSGNNPIAAIWDPICLVLIAVLSALIARRTTAPGTTDSIRAVDSDIIATT